MSTAPACGPEAGAAVPPSGATWSAKRISVLLTIVALVLWAISISQARFEIGFFGLIGGLSVTLFIALGVLTIAAAVLWFSKDDHGGLLFLQTCVLILAIWSVPYIVRGSPQQSMDIYSDRGYIEFVAKHGSYSPTDHWMFNWPLGWVLWAIVLQVSGVTDIPIHNCWLPVLPMVWQFAIMPVLYVFFRNTIGKTNANYCWAALWFFYVGNWFELLNSGAQSFGMFFAYALMAILTMTVAWEQRATLLGMKTTSVLVLAASTVAHMLGSLVAVGITLGLVATRRVKSYGLVVLAIVFMAAWTVYGSVQYLEFKLPSFIGQGVRVDVATQQGILDPLAGDRAHAVVAGIRIALTGMLCLLGGLGAIVGSRIRDNRRADLTVLSICVCCAVVGLIIGAAYGAELYQRFYVLLLPGLAYFAVKLLRHKATAVLLLVVLLAALPMVFVAKYGNQTLDHMSSPYLRGAEHFYEHSDGGYIIAVLPMGRMDDFEEYEIGGYEDLAWKNGQVVFRGETFDELPRYVVISDHERAWFGFYLNRLRALDGIESMLEGTSDVALVYANPEVSLYAHE